ncbi:MAG: YceI family protein [Bacteroidota bacterium]
MNQNNSIEDTLTMPETEASESVTNKVNWKLDPVHSEISFKVKHMMITNVRGILKDYTVKVVTEDEEFTNAKIRFTGETSSITTGNDQRDTHLRSADFFDVVQNPEITFVSTSYSQMSTGIYKLQGNLCVKGVTKAVSLDVQFGGIQKDPWGKVKAGFSVNGKINRKDFGLNWNTILEAGGTMVSDDVYIMCEIQLVKS